jgi:hypothetical protein
VVGLGAVFAVLVGMALIGHRRGDPVARASGGMGALAILVAVAAAASTPVDGPFGAVSGNFRFLWPLGALVALTVVVGALRLLRWSGPRWTGWVLPAVAAGLAILALPTRYESPAPESDAERLPAARELYRELSQADLPEPVRFVRGRAPFGEPYSYVVIAGLQAAGVDVVFDDAIDLARFGDDRAAGQVAGDLVLWVGAGDDPPGELIASAADPGLGEVAVVFVPSQPAATTSTSSGS